MASRYAGRQSGDNGRPEFPLRLPRLNQVLAAARADSIPTLATGCDLLRSVIVGLHFAGRRVYIHVSDGTNRRMGNRGDEGPEAPDCPAPRTYGHWLVGPHHVTDVFQQPTVGFTPGGMRVYDHFPKTKNPTGYGGAFHRTEPG